MFTSARIKLTFWYLTVIMLISLTFSGVIYGIVSREVDRFESMQRTRMERKLRDEIIFPSGPGIFRRLLEQDGMANPELVRETKERILYVLFLANGSIFILAGWFGYVLAGRTLRPIQKMVDDQHRFVSDASHELKTPLASLKIGFEVYLRDSKRTLHDADELVRESIEEVGKLQSLTESLLNLAEYENRDASMGIEKVSLKTIVDDAVKKLKNIAHKRNIGIKTNIPDITIHGNKKGLTSVFTILIDNAIKYSNEGSEVVVSAQTKESTVRISVKDQGMGISLEDLPRIFDRFYRADSSRKKSGAGGNGLGLSIARQIALEHQGSLHAESTLGQGSEFILELPTQVSNA